jgi:16S rRNA (guanine527-N7)-methyltransferase
VTEDEAKIWLVDTLGVSRETKAQLDAFRQMVIAENAHQNLVSAASIPHFWVRHIVDSAQLLAFVGGDGKPDAAWLDLGTGAGFPGMVIAILRNAPIHLVEERRKRHEFLAQSASTLGLDHVTVHGCRVETLNIPPVGVISARAFAPLPKLFAAALPFSRKKTVWLLPKGRSAKEELESARSAWQGVFHVKQSLTDPDAAIIVATGVRPEAKTR